MLWDWVFSTPQDEIAEGARTIIQFDWFALPERYKGNEFAEGVPGYKKWPDKKRKQFQKEYFKFMRKLSDKERGFIFLKLFLGTHKKWTK